MQRRGPTSNKSTVAPSRSFPKQSTVIALLHSSDGLPNKALQQTGLSLAFGSLWRPQLNAATLGRLGEHLAVRFGIHAQRP
jgi:hypothetical protein